MSRRTSDARADLLKKLSELVANKLPEDEAKLLCKFIEQYYSTVSLEDLLSHDIMDLYGAVLSHWRLMYQRKPGETKLHIYNPDYEQHGWQTTHTVIEICHDDMPFLVDSIQMELNRRGLTTHMILHVGGFKVKRDGQDRIVKVYSAGSHQKECSIEAPIFIEIDRQTDPSLLADLKASILNILDDVALAVFDWEKMMTKLYEIIDELEKTPPNIDPKEIKQSIEFLRWIGEDHFTFLGYREYDLDTIDNEIALFVKPGTGLGVLQKGGDKRKISRSFSSMPEDAKKLALSKNLLIIAKTNTKSTVHRPAYTDYIGIKIFDNDGNIIGERRIIGLFTSAAYNRNPRDIPGLAQKVQTVLKNSKLSPRGHAGKALLNIIETLPRDDLFQASSDELLDLSMGILQLQERRRIRLFARKDIYSRFISCFVYIPREQYNTDIRLSFQVILADAFHATETSFQTYFSESVLCRIHFMIRIDPKDPPNYDIKAIEKQLIDAGRTWEDELRESLIEQYGEETGNEYASKYHRAFPAGYRESNISRTAVLDIDHIEMLKDENALAMSFSRPLGEPEGILRFKLYRRNLPVPLSDALPILENMGLRVLGEQPYCLHLLDGSTAWINDFSMEHANSNILDVDKVKFIFQEAFAKVWFGNAENDRFNSLVLSAQLNWREVGVLRSYAKYFKQLGFTFSQSYIEETLTQHANISRKLVELFIVRFTPNIDQQEVTNRITLINEQIDAGLEHVSSRDEDKILRHYRDVMMATMRTNYFQTNKTGQAKEYLSFKLNPELLADIPKPKPKHEIFVYSPSVEGVHLRSGDVARGGLRWSDRREDFRTEVLGLMKAQRVKNAVIVPAGAKGGFIAKNLPTDGSRDEMMKAGVECYQTFIRGLLDITDNMINGEILPPENVRSYDKEDPYLVVAADKGTATFSDYANEVSEDYGHWLGDGFASGGKTGYDHKKMGITARGAWESVKRHFRELGLNTQEEDFTVVGIGDMSGDVFGNGMLLSDHIRLVAAFNHMHIFIDPNPDAEKSFAERKRLFELPRSTWADYNPDLISKGGGVFKRSAKFISVNSTIASLLDIPEGHIEPDHLIQAILKAQVDLLWNGGIGTYVKAARENNSDVGDRTNDGLRVNANELRCRVVGEGGNLGLTQLARVEYALNKGKIYTDFIDNSAGVDCSDHEVNIKILLNQVVENGDMTIKQRNNLLADMTDDVAKLVLQNNIYQTQAISLAAQQAYNNRDLYIRFIVALEASGRLDREIEFLPDDKELLERKSKGQGLTPPEIAVLMSYSKIQLKEDILASSIPEDNYLGKFVETSFPDIINKNYADYVNTHSLRREIIATQLSNMIINEMGLTFVSRAMDETGGSISSVVRAYIIAREVFVMKDIWNQIESLDYKVDSQVQIEMMLTLGGLIRRATRWFIRHHRDLSNLSDIIEHYKGGVSQLYSELADMVMGRGKKTLKAIYKSYIERDVPTEIAQLLSSAEPMFSALDIIAASNEYKYKATHVAKVYFALGARLDLAWFRKEITVRIPDTHWESLAKASLRDDIDWQQRELTVSALRLMGDKALLQSAELEMVLDNWANEHEVLVNRWNDMITELRSVASLEFVMLSVATRELADLTEASHQSVQVLEAQTPTE